MFLSNKSRLFLLRQCKLAGKLAKTELLSHFFASVSSGNWTVSKNVKLFFEKRSELSICQDCLVWGPKVVIPEVLRSTLLKELRLGIVKMKKVTRSYAWWLGIDKNIKMLVKSCDECLQTRNKLLLVSCHLWQLAERSWQRIHNDFAAPFLRPMFLIVIDSFSKMPEVIVIKSTTAKNTINKLCSLFSRWGIPEQIDC